MKKFLISSVIVIILLSCCLSFSIKAQYMEGVYIVDVDKIPPNVIIDGGVVTGFDIDIWESVAYEMGLKFKYREVPFNQIIEDLKTGSADVGVAAITINEKREKEIDFSHHYMDSGLRIAVPKGYIKDLSFKDVFTNVFVPFAKTFFYFAIFIFACGNTLWLAERGNNDSINDSYFPGIFESLWCVVATVTTAGYGDIVPKKWAGRCCACVIMVIGIGFCAMVIAYTSSMLTMDQLRGNISGYQDLKGRTVATKSDTTSEQILKTIGADVLTYDKIEDVYKTLEEDGVPVVFDAPSVMYFANNSGLGKVSIAGDMFDLQYYGIALRENSNLREGINRALLKIRESGESKFS